MAEENQLAGNLLQTQEEADRKAATQGQQPASTQPVYNPLLGVSQRQFMQIMAGNDPSKPMVTTDQYGIPQFHFENYGQNQPTQVNISPYGHVTVPAVQEAMKQNAEQIAQELNDFHASFAPEFAKDHRRSSYFNELVQGGGQFVSEAGKSGGAMIMHSVHGLLAQKRNFKEMQWEFIKSEHKDDINFQLAGAEVKRLEDAGLSQMAIRDADVDSMDIPEEAKDYFRQYQRLVGARMADERRMRIAMAYEQDKTNIQNFMESTDALKPLGGDEEAAINSIAKMSGQVAGSVAVFYLTGRLVGLAGATAGRLGTGLKAANATAKAQNAVALAQAGGTDAFLTAAANIGSKYVFAPSFLNQYDSIRTQSLLAGKSLAEANAIGFVAGVAEGSLEFAGFKYFKRFYTDGGWFKNYVIRNIVPEALQEGAQTTAENVITQVTGVTNKQWEDIMAEIGMSIVGGALGGGMFSFWRAKTLGMDAWISQKAEDLANSWGNLNKQQINEVVNVVHQAIEANPVTETEPKKDFMQMFADNTEKQEEAQKPSTTKDYLEAYKKLSAEQKTAAEAYFEAVDALYEHYVKRVKELNPKVTPKQLQNGFKHIQAQVLAQKDHNALVQTFEGAIDQAVAYLKPDSEVVKHNTEVINDKLFKAGYTPEQISRLTSGDAIEKHDAQWEEASNFIVRQATAMGIDEAEAKLMANFIKSIAYDASLASPNSSPQAIVEAMTRKLINVQVATLHGQPLPALFRSILNSIKKENFEGMSTEEQVEVATNIANSLDANEISDSEAASIAQTLFGDPTMGSEIKRLQNSLASQAELTGKVIEHMPLKIEGDGLNREDYRTMTLLRFMGQSWDNIFLAWGINKTTDATYSEAFEKAADDYFPKLDKVKLGKLRRLAYNANPTEIPGYKSEPAYSKEEINKMKSSTGFYDADERAAVLVNPKPGTALHEANHFSLSFLVTSASELESMDLLTDMSPIHRLYSYLRDVTKVEGLELTEEQLQETVNDAVNDFLVNGQSKDPVVTRLLNQMQAAGIKRYKALINSKYNKKGGKSKAISEEQKQALQAQTENMLAGVTPGTMLADAYALQEEARLEKMPEEFTTVEGAGLAKWAERIKEFGRKYPVMEAPEEMIIDSCVAAGNAIGLAQMASELSVKAIEIATDAFVQNKSYSTEGELDRGTTGLFFEAEAAISPEEAGKTLRNLGFRKQQTIGEQLQDVQWSKTGSLLAQAGKNLFQSLEGALGELDNALGKNGYAKGQLRSLCMKQFYDYGVHLQEFREAAKPMVEAVDKEMDKYKLAGRDQKALEWYQNFHLVLRQGQKGAYKKAGDFLEKELGKKARESYDKCIAKLQEVTKMMLQAGVSESQLAVGGDFFPFAINNYDRFVKEFLGKDQAYSTLEKEKVRFIEEYKKDHPEESEENLAKLYVALVDNMNSMFQRNADSETKVTSFNHRTMVLPDDVDLTIFEYYADPFNTLDKYMEAAYRTVMMRNLIGKVTYTEDGKPILLGAPDSTGQIGAYIMSIPYGAVPEELKNNVLDKMRALAARDAGDKNTIIDVARQINQLTTLGSFFNAMNQLMDVPFITAMYGPKAVGDAIADMMSKAGSSLTLEDVGALTANEVFRIQDEAVLSRITKTVFKATGFEWTDRKIKEVALNAAAKWAQDIMKENRASDRRAGQDSQRYAELKYVIDECFPAFDMNMIPQGMSEARANEIAEERNAKRKDLMNALARGGKNEDGSWNEDAKYVYWYMLTKLQPINAATVSANYNRVGALGKSMYQFSTVATRQLGFLMDFWRMKFETSGGAKAAVMGMLQFVGFCMAIGVPKDMLEAILKGRTPDIGGSFVMTPLHVFMINEYTLAVAKREGIVSAIGKTYMPKLGIADNISKDLYTVFTGKDFKFNTSKNIPILGAFMYAWLFGGSEQTIKQGRDIFGRTQDPVKARKVRESNLQKEESLDFMENIF